MTADTDARTAFSSRLADLRRRIADACETAGRHPSDLRIVAVTKTHPPDVAQLAVDTGQVELAENRVQELLAKQARVRGARWHLVGRLQRNKAKEIVGRTILIHSVDRRSLAETLSRRASAVPAVQRLLVQVNVGDDPAKGGCDLDQVGDLVAYARGLPYLSVEGLMTMPPLPADGVDPNQAARPYFATLRALRDELRQEYPEVAHLSMGMSADLEAAVAEGATILRIGSALFGPRGDKPWRP